jgi:hypothetical protein
MNYATLENCLMAMHGIDEIERGRFRARITNLMRMHVLGQHSHPGKGSRRDYGIYEVHKLIFVMELEEVGMLPRLIVRIVNEMWAPIGAAFAESARLGAPTLADILVGLCDVRMMTSEWEGTAPFRIETFALAKLLTALDLIGDRRIMLFNVSELLRRFNAALARQPARPSKLGRTAGLLANLG